MPSPAIHQIEAHLRPFYGDDERLGVLLSYCVGRVMLRSAKAGDDWEYLARDEDVRHITDWLKAAVVNDDPWLKNIDDRGRPKKLMKFSSIEDITKEANKAMLKAAQRLSNVKLVEGDEELYAELNDGFYLVRLLTPAALDRESAQMQHCIGDGAYDAELDKPGNIYLSLRDKHGKAHATLEVNHGQLIQLQGKQNTVPVDIYLEALIPFLKTTGWKIHIPPRKLGHVIDVNGDWFKLDKLPKGLTVGGNLDLLFANITHLPEGLTVGGDLDLRETSVTHLPERLIVGGCLDLQGSDITHLPNGLTVGGDLYLYGTKITHLPEGLSVGGIFSLSGTKITHLPGNLIVGGNLNLQDTNITHLSPGLTVGGDLNLQGNRVTHLPEGVTVDGSLLLIGTNITQLPDSLSPETFVYTKDGRGMTAEEFRNLARATTKMLH